jgi:tripartite-type tricarboxylate transporter receptor subunit TctC
MRRAFLLALAAALGLGLGLPALAQAWPAKTVRILVAAPPGGAADILTRMVSEGLSKELGQPVVIEYKPGASGTIAVQELLSAPADGYTFLMIQRGIVSELPQAMKVRYDGFTDFQPVVQLAYAGLLLVGSPQLPAQDLAALVAHAKAQRGGLPYAAIGAGLLSHTTGLQFARLAGIELTFVGYQGAAPAVQDLLGGHIPLMVESPVPLVSYIRSGRVRAYATTAPRRSAALPDVPTFAEAGYPGLSEVSWFALWSRPQVPAGARDRVRAEVVKWLALPQTQARLAELGLDPGLPLTPTDLARDLREARDKQAGILRAIRYKPE